MDYENFGKLVSLISEASTLAVDIGEARISDLLDCTLEIVMEKHNIKKAYNVRKDNGA